MYWKIVDMLGKNSKRINHYFPNANIFTERVNLSHYLYKHGIVYHCISD